MSTDRTDGEDDDTADAAMQALFTQEVIAFHEAGHAVVRYRTLGMAGGRVSIVSKVGERLGGTEDMFPDGPKPVHVESKILSYYAGGHAQRAVDPRCGGLGCWHDDEQAAELLREFGWEAREQELRDRSLAVTQQHWSEIVAVVKELLRVLVLEEAEVEIIADVAAGDVHPELTVEATDLAAYRRVRGPDLEQWRRQRQIAGDDD